MDGTILYLVQCESLCRISVFPPLTGCDRLAQLVDTDTESELEEAPSKAEESQPLGSRVPLMSEEFDGFNPSEGRKEEAVPEGQQSVVPAVDTAVGQSSRSVPRQQGAKRVSASRQPTLTTGVSPLSLVVPSPIASLVATPTATISVDADQFLEVGAQLELYGSILHDHTSGAVRDEIFSQRYRFRSLERERKRATMTFSIENYDLRRQIIEERHERLELTDHIARMERRHESGGE
ncbi:hypothetical protein Tco_1314667 [Tanacetum coccineum]